MWGPEGDSVAGMFFECMKLQWCIVAPQWTTVVSLFLNYFRRVSCIAQIQNLEEGSLYGGQVDDSYI